MADIMELYSGRSSDLGFKASIPGTVGSYNWMKSTYIPLHNLQIQYVLNNSSCLDISPQSGRTGAADMSDDIDFISRLVHELIHVEVAKMKYTRELQSRTVATCSLHSIQIQCVKNYELVIAGLLEIMTFNPSEISNLGLHAVDLVEYCNRKVCYQTLCQN